MRKTFKQKLAILQKNYPYFSKEYLETKAEKLGSYSFFPTEFSVQGLGWKKFLKELGVKEIEKVSCELCGKTYYKKINKNLTTSLIRHQIKCKEITEFIKNHNCSTEFLEKELQRLGTVTDFIKNYPEIKSHAYFIFKKFNVDCSMKRVCHTVLKRKEKNNMEHYGVPHNFSKNHPSRQKWEKRLLEDEAIINVFQRPDVKYKILKTIQSRYGVDHPSQNSQVLNRMRKTSIEKYGYDHWMKNPENLKEFCDLMSDKFNIKYQSMGDLSKINNHGIVFSKPHKKVVETLNKLNILNSVEFILKINKDEHIDGMNKYRYEYDILLSNTNKLIEVNGDYYHANPSMYKKNDLINIFGKELKVEDIWAKDSLKFDFAIKKGYNILVLWEKDIMNDSYFLEKRLKDYAEDTN